MKKIFIIILAIFCHIETGLAMVPTTPETIKNHFIKIDPSLSKIKVTIHVSHDIPFIPKKRYFPDIITEWGVKIVNENNISVIDHKIEENLLNIYSREKDRTNKKVNIYTLKKGYIKDKSVFRVIMPNNNIIKINYIFTNESYPPFGGMPFYMTYE